LNPLRFSDREVLINLDVHSIRSLGPAIKKLRLDFRNDEFGMSIHPNPFLISGSTPFNDPPTIRTDALIRSIPSLLSQVPSLETFEVHLPAAKSTVNDKGIADNYHIPRLSNVLHGLSTAFQTSPVKELSDLRLFLPCTNNFAQLSRDMPFSLLSRLRHLYLETTDATSPGGSNLNLFWYDEVSDGDEDVPLSNLQQLSPDSAHAADFFALVSKCPNLEALGITCTHHLDLNLLAWTDSPPPSSLSVLFLNRIRVSASSLRVLLSPHLNRLYIEDVSLTSGTWSSVFDHLRLCCPALTYLNPCNLTYARDGSSKDLIRWWNRPWDYAANIWTSHDPDVEALRGLVRLLVERAGGKDKYPSGWLEQDCLYDE
jgi:hypothetical protein